ncbi:MAG: tetratricopeptide repeat protein [Bacteroidales bacterium]|nr:tetratricopeptide repeat protein [Bacteroidales bacterium]
MAKVNTKEKEAARQENIEQKVSATEKFYTENRKYIRAGLISILVIGLAILAFSKYVYQPKCAEAMEQMFPAENNFQLGEYDLALNGDGNVYGFSQIIDEYGAKAGKSVYMYAGICEYNLGNYSEALALLKKYKGKDSILAARAQACEGDCYIALEDYSSAAKSYDKAAKTDDSVFAAGYLVKSGLAYEKMGDKASALARYEKVKDAYPQAIESYDIDRYINRVAE